MSVSPEGLKKVFLLSSGSEATECAIKLSRAHGIKVGGTSKIGIIGGFDRGYHGRTLASQQAGGMAGQKAWIVNPKSDHQRPFPDGYWEETAPSKAF